MVKPAREFLGFFDAEGAAVGAPGCPKEGYGHGGEVRRGTGSEATQVEDEPKYPVNQGDKELVELVPGDWVLAKRCVRCAQQDEYRYNAGGDCLLEAAGVGDF